MRELTCFNRQVSYDEYIVIEKETRRTETSKYPEEKKVKDDIVIELREPSLVLGDHTAKGVKAIYPSFDITPPELIDGFVTDKAIFKASELNKYFDKDNVSRFYILI